jgi:hypothetical protein
MPAATLSAANPIFHFIDVLSCGSALFLKVSGAVLMDGQHRVRVRFPQVSAVTPMTV